jgi:mannose-1-phosphate guanylyltransferase
VLKALIMAGGSGTRFWPMSRDRLPKQFLTFHGERSLIQQTFDRIEGLVGTDGVLIFTNAKHVSKTLEQLPTLRPEQVVGEPAGRDTAPCIGLAAALLVREDPDAHMIVLAADHLIQPTSAFHEAVRSADAVVTRHPAALVTFGIPPLSPSTAYGYLRRDPDLTAIRFGAKGSAVHRLKSFHEKPDVKTAQQFVASGQYYWNSGIFCWKAATVLSELARNAPQIHEATQMIADAWDTPKRDEVFSRVFASVPKKSIDYAVMEHAREIYMVESPFQWDDVGSWLALERVLAPDSHRNVSVGLHVAQDSQGCVVASKPDHLVCTLGVRDLIVVHTPDATLVADRKDEQSVKKLLDRLKELGLEQYL